MRLVVDATPLSDGSRDRGIGRYVSNVLAGLVHHDDLEIVALAGRGARLPDEVVGIPVTRAGHHRLAPLTAAALLPLDIARARGDLFWSPGLTVPRHTRLPWVHTLHDLTPLVVEQGMLARDAARWNRAAPRLARAGAVIAVSHSTAAQGRDLLGLDPAKTTVIPHGVGPEFDYRETAREETARLLWVASWGPHKGLRDAVAVSDLLAEQGVRHTLRVAGRQDEWQVARVADDVSAARHRNLIEIVGGVDDIAEEYRRADLLIMSSRGEGFGLPVAEALACGCPVVSYDNTALPETVGSLGVLSPDGDVRALAEAVVKVLPSAWVGRPARSSAARRRFSWQTSVDRHLEVFQRVMASPRPGRR